MSEPIRTSHSQRVAYHTCPVNWHLHTNQRLETTRPRPALLQGTIFAQVVESKNEPTWIITSLISQLEEEEKLLGMTDEEVGDLILKLDIAGLMGEHYLARYGEAPKREIEFEIPLGEVDGRPVIDVGYIDGADDEWLIEDKFHSIQAWRPVDQSILIHGDEQLTGYLYAARELGLPERMVKRVTMKPALRKRKGESSGEFLNRISDDVYKRPDHYFRAVHTKRTDEQLEAWRDAALETVEEQQRRMANGMIRPRTQNCVSKYGPCQFISLCYEQPGAELQYQTRQERTRQAEAVGVKHPKDERTSNEPVS